MRCHHEPPRTTRRPRASGHSAAPPQGPRGSRPLQAAPQAWSQPWYGPKDWEEYERFAASSGVPTPVDPEAKWLIVPQPNGIMVMAEW